MKCAVFLVPPKEITPEAGSAVEMRLIFSSIEEMVPEPGSAVEIRLMFSPSKEITQEPISAVETRLYLYYHRKR